MLPFEETGEKQMINKKEIGEALDLCIELLEKATPKKPKGISLTHEGRVANCSSCNKLVTVLTTTQISVNVDSV